LKLEARLKRKIAAILAADVVEYSRLVAEDEEETLRRLVSYRSVFDDFVTKADGRIFNTAGDAVLAEFPSAVDALRAAIDIQESLRTRNMAYPPSRHMQFRMGLTVGDVVEREGDLLGDGVNIAARLQGLAVPGGICVSRSVHEQVANKLSVLFNDLGPQEVKNIPAPVYVYRVDLGRDHERPAASTPPKSSARAVMANPFRQRSLRYRRFLFTAAILLAVFAGVAGIRFINKTWLLWEVASSTKPAADAVQAHNPRPVIQKPSTEAPRDVTATVRTLVGMPFNAADAPFLCDRCRGDLDKGVTGKPGHSAVVLSLDGGSFWSFGKTTTVEARKLALAQCLDARRLDCFVYAIDGVITWAEPPPPLPMKPWFKRDPQTEQPIDFQKLPNVYDGDKPRIAQLYSRFQGKALAVGPLRQWAMTGRADSDEEAARIVLERCGYITHLPCRVITLGNSLVVPLASLETWPTAAPAMPSAINATGPVYAPSGPAVLPGDIPFICDDCRERVGKALGEQRLHTAVVISLAGGFWIVGDRGTAEEARTVALGQCLAADPLMCFVYALDGQTVWKEAALPMPAAPWFTHDAQIEQPLDVAAIPELSAASKQYIRDFYSPVKTPKAIAAGHGTFALAFGLRFPARSENEAARMALERCGYIAQAPCRIIAINESSVVKFGAN
jgi:class 3 adenylate cyclase